MEKKIDTQLSNQTTNVLNLSENATHVETWRAYAAYSWRYKSKISSGKLTAEEIAHENKMNEIALQQCLDILKNCPEDCDCKGGAQKRHYKCSNELFYCGDCRCPDMCFLYGKTDCTWDKQSSCQCHEAPIENESCEKWCCHIEQNKNDEDTKETCASCECSNEGIECEEDSYEEGCCGGCQCSGFVEDEKNETVDMKECVKEGGSSCCMEECQLNTCVLECCSGYTCTENNFSKNCCGVESTCCKAHSEQVTDLTNENENEAAGQCCMDREYCCVNGCACDNDYCCANEYCDTSDCSCSNEHCNEESCNTSDYDFANDACEDNENAYVCTECCLDKCCGSAKVMFVEPTSSIDDDNKNKSPILTNIVEEKIEQVEKTKTVVYDEVSENSAGFWCGIKHWLCF